MDKTQKRLKKLEKGMFKKPELKTEMIALRVTPSTKKWLKANDMEPGLIFNEAVRLLMKQS